MKTEACRVRRPWNAALQNFALANQRDFEADSVEKKGDQRQDEVMTGKKTK